jgi:2-(1,2-epoxy-1,2-dihydrophenyl)acetyl-CoA isomerase
MSDLTVLLHREGPAATIELHRPDTMNAWNRRFGEELLEAVQTCAEDDGVRAVVVTGAGRGFSSGADLRSFGQAGEVELTPEGRPDLRQLLEERYHPIITGIREMPKPVVAAVNGPCVGIGLSLALACDLVVAAESAYFLLAFVNIGLVPDGGSSLFVPARVGFTRAMELALLGERLPAAEALRWGLINRVVPDEGFREEVHALHRRLADGPTASYAGSKRQLNAWLYDRMHQQLDLEASIQQEMAGTADFAEGASAFAQRRQAAFRGR